MDHITLTECYGISSLEEDLLDLKDNFETFLDRVPAGFGPVAGCNSDQICIATSPHEYGKVYLWDHIDEGADDNTYLIADSFSEFLLCLNREAEESEE